MIPGEFIAKWRSTELRERAGAQTHFNDLCLMLGERNPTEGDPADYTFEKGASIIGGSDGWADVWKRGCFAWEYKSPGKNLDQALLQLKRYSGTLDNPPLLIVCDMERFRIHANWTNTVQHTYEFVLDDLADARVRQRLKWAFSDGEVEQLRPGKTRQDATREVADDFVRLAQSLRDRGHDPEKVAHFVNRMVFCMFAEDVDLLPDKLFQRLLQLSLDRGADTFVKNAERLFGAMKRGGDLDFITVDWFNGGIFDDANALPLTRDDLKVALKAARKNWSDIDPSIMGTLFERGLDPSKRSQLGAHYTDAAKIMLIINPVIVEPLMREWEAARSAMAQKLEAAKSKAKQTRTKAHNEAVALHAGFISRLKAFRVLDPACGSGNFLYLALKALKDIEHKANTDAEALGLPRGFPVVGPECVKGIEINPFAAELARVSVWIGEIQWMREHGFDATRNPILKPLETIECRDALLNPDGTEAEWPPADVIIGNPPFLGGKLMRGVLENGTVEKLFVAYDGRVPAEADLVCYWFAKGWTQVEEGFALSVGLVSTNSIRGGANREVLDTIAEQGRITSAWSDEPWMQDGAAVRVSLVAFDRGNGNGSRQLDGNSVARINPDLTSSVDDLTKVSRLAENRGIAFMGDTKGGAFDIAGDIARGWLEMPLNPNGRPNSDVLKFWWRHVEPRQGMWSALEPIARYIATPTVAKHRVFVWCARTVCPDHQLIVTARDDDTAFGILHSRFHELWSLRMCTWLGVGNDPRYTPTTCFETFPFPEGLTPNIPAADYAGDPRAQSIAAAAVRLNELRETWLNPPDLVQRVPEVVPGYPDRILPIDAAAAAILKKRTLTNLYNERPTWLDNAHRDLDAAVAAAYGWPADLSDDEILSRLFQLNQERAAKQ